MKHASTQHRSLRRLLPIIAAAMAFPVLLAAWSPAPAPPPTPVERTGFISAWRVADDGTVALRLGGESASGKAFSIWFATPPNQTSTTRFEDLALRAIIAVRASGDPVTVRGERRGSREGRTVDDAIELMSITAGE